MVAIYGLNKKDNFPIWSQQSSGMLQYIIWTELEVEGLGAPTAKLDEMQFQPLEERIKVFK